MKRITWLDPEASREWFPPLEQALEDPPGLLAAGGDLSSERLLAAYRRGIFPWYSPGQPILWWCPDPRTVLFPAQFRRHRSLAKTMRNKDLDLFFNQDFEAVIDACAAPRARSPGTWITPEMRAAYLELHRLGFAHSVEVRAAGVLIGGLYGVRLGGVFFGESMFSRARDGSKIALAHLAASAPASGIALIDCQMPSAHLASLGARSLPRAQFQALLERWVTLAPRALQGPSGPP
ncbi:MAG: leucyl/phenylalanyl-tRNA--protein transferase [Pseudomonadota bacterium]|jgi:leucyl/phenylalanyl-tRNA--protein transferase|nr:leucyl/phenylalanyl-tRNA--protein transferase [Pseudomonadota bacterium]